VRHPHLNYGNFMLWLEFEQLQGHTKFIVEVSLRAQHVEAGPEHFRDGFLGGGLAGAAGDSDDPLVPMPAHGGGQGLQGDERIVNDQQRMGMREVKKINHLASRDDRGARSSLERSGDKVMRIVTLTADREKKIPSRACVCRWNIPSPAAPPDPRLSALDRPPSNERCPAIAASFAYFPGQQYLLCDGHIIERYHPVANRLSFFVSFAGQ
jgi:hypothetical protein